MLSFENAIVCEDIRPEKFNKHSLMGIYPGNIIVAEMPTAIQLAVFLEYKNAAGGETVRFDIVFGKAKFKGKYVIPKGNPDGAIIFPKGLMKFNEDGIAKIKASIDGGRWRTLINKTIAVGKMPEA